MCKFFMFFLLLLFCNTTFSQLHYPVVGEFKNQPAEGFAIYQNKAFLFNNGGACRILNLGTGKIEKVFMLASANKFNHVNTACFGNEYVGANKLPVIYISECGQRSRCFVENIANDTVSIVQVIEVVHNGIPINAGEWIIDNQRGFLYSICMCKDQKDSEGNVPNVITKYRLPKLDDGMEVFLTERDVLDSFVVSFPNLLQGGKIRDNRMYVVVGLQQSSSERKEAGRALIVIDLVNRKMIRKQDLTYITTNEPEDLDFYDGNILIFTGQQGGLYDIKL